ncbi:MAG: hypothetical protein KDA88_18090 [Planctomycetaceae bacterium]|nr:hypothetical protein [Planctomycetaceae bacterium]MCB9953332.1 hypothetical protein [Planctomycetaceae bacterium]
MTESVPVPATADTAPTPQGRTREDMILAVLGLCFAAFLLFRALDGAGVAYVAEMNGTQAEATEFDYLIGTAEYSYSRTLGMWIAAFCTLAIFSFLYKDNVAYKIAESVFVGVSAAYWMIVAFWTVIIPNLLGKVWPGWIRSWAIPGLSPVRDELWWLYLIPLILGGMLLWRLSPKGAWIARWPLAFIIGSTAGIRLIGFLQADFLSQVRNTIVPVITFADDGGLNIPSSLRNIVLVAAVVSGLVYFFFSIEHKGFTGRVSKVGIWVLMITFGAAFGYTVMGRIALLAIRFEFLFNDWLHLNQLFG